MVYFTFCKFHLKRGKRKIRYEPVVTDVSTDAGKARALMCTNGFGTHPRTTWAVFTAGWRGSAQMEQYMIKHICNTLVNCSGTEAVGV